MGNVKYKIAKVLRYWSIWGLNRTLTKVSGRLRNFKIFTPKYFKQKPFIGLIGCGQFQFSTIAYYLSKGWVNKFLFSYDVDNSKARFLADFYKIPKVAKEDEIYDLKDTELVYIASNHASHSSYAINYLKKDIDVFSEKPIAVSFPQFDELIKNINQSGAKFYVGYNRPYSPAIEKLKKSYNQLNNNDKRFTLQCFVAGHDIPDDHWYRNPKEGTRICGNVGHWIDLMIHIYNWRGEVPRKYSIQIAYSDVSEPDDNITISITTDKGDLTSISISSRTDPFEGINETINFQYSDLIAKIDDFRKITIWNNEKKDIKRYWPKDVGHERSVMQPFHKDNRDPNEVISSTELMLHITQMVQNIETKKEIELTRSL